MAIPINAKMKPRSDYALLDAEDVAFKDGRLPDYLPVTITQEDYDALVAAGKVNENTPYLIVESDAG